MNKNRWNDKWLALPRGQRRATIVLLCVVVMLAVARLVVAHITENKPQVPADYSSIEQEIELFRMQLDTIPVEERRPVYLRRTHARPDSTIDNIKPRRKPSQQAATPQPRRIEPVPRLDDDEQ